MYYKNIVIGYSENLIKTLLTDLDKVSKFLKENNISFYLITGLSKESFEKINLKYNLYSYFNKANIYSIDPNYLNQLSDIDREIRSEKYKINKEYVDEYFKIYFLNKIKPEINNEKTLFLGNDIWTDAYYISEYTKSNVILLKPNILFNKEKYNNDLKTIKTIDFNVNQLKNILKDKQDFDYTKLKSFAKNYLISKTIGKLNLNIDLKKIYKK